ncbi:MAG TPA: RagB/SusD family nutrient uptake outer membrane protein [Ferruginibacter sp.]|nr:RagB/SusD family nutrient uptake outer membrane protein [Ferruginibacter sp.]HMP21451.1 RagB/SusD family nutrient uptake outer membrane protein [Ferruginibacter sp.]
MKSKLFISALLITTVTLTSCKKFLDVAPKESTSDDITIVDENSARTAVRGIFNQLSSNAYYGYTFQTLGFFSGDNIQYTGSQTVNRQLTNHDVKSDLGALATSWSGIYNTINRANNALEKIPQLPVTATFTEAVKNQLIGEAYFVRALAYFDLGRTWGGVQLILKPVTSPASRPVIKRSTLAETYKQVQDDLDAAEALLPNTVNRIRATRKTVWALKARLFLYQKQWDKAVEFATKLIEDKTNYDLLKPYNSFFANSASNTKESVLELYYTSTVTNNQSSQWLPTTKGGVGWIRPTLQIAELLNNPLIGGTRSSLLQKAVVSGIEDWYGNLYYRTPGTDPAFLIRIAELYLIRAEAYANLDKLTEATADLNAIRERAGLAALPVNGKNDLLLAIENENRVEFAFENHRWYDLVRTGRAASVLGITNADKLLLPIPFREVLADAPNLEQNPSYTN